MIRNTHLVLCLLVALVPGFASAVVIDIGPSAGRVEVGASGLPSAPGANTNGTNYSSTLVVSGISVAVSNLNASGAGVGGIDWRDRGDSTSSDPLVLMGEDFVKNNAGIIRLTLTGVAAGTYDAIGYHMDPGFDQASSIQVLLETTPGSGTFAASGTPGDAGAAIGGVNNLTTANMQATTSNFQFVSNGIDPVIIIFDATASGDTEAPLNGIEFNLVPEPSTALLGLVGGLFLMRRRR